MTEVTMREEKMCDVCRGRGKVLKNSAEGKLNVPCMKCGGTGVIRVITTISPGDGGADTTGNKVQTQIMSNRRMGRR